MGHGARSGCRCTLCIILVSLALIAGVLSKAQGANVREVALIALLAATFGVVSKADGLIIGGTGRALPLGSCLSLGAFALAIFAFALAGPRLPGL